MERLLAGRYWVVWGFAVKKKWGGNRRSGAKWVKIKCHCFEYNLYLK